jgi:GntR family transcriptional regulator
VHSASECVKCSAVRGMRASWEATRTAPGAPTSRRSATLADWTKGQPAYQQVADALRAKIRAGELGEGDQLPSYAALMDEFGVSVTVARSAIAHLRSEGLVSTHQGKGAFVLPGAAEGAAARDTELTALRSELEALTQRVARLEAKGAG